MMESNACTLSKEFVLRHTCGHKGTHELRVPELYLNMAPGRGKSARLRPTRTRIDAGGILKASRDNWPSAGKPANFGMTVYMHKYSQKHKLATRTM